MSSREKKTVTGYPVQQSHVSVGYPAPSAPSAAAAPPPYPHVASTLKEQGCCCCGCFCLIIYVFINIFIVTMIVIHPDPHLPEFQVGLALVSPLTSNRSELTAAWNFTFLIRNPNHRYGISYHNLQASVYYKEIKLSTIELPPFYQEKRNKTRMLAGLSVMGEYVGGDVMKGILREKDVETVHFGVEVFGRLRYRGGWWWMTIGLEGTGKHSLWVYCEGLRIGYLDNNATGSLLGQPKACKVNPSTD